MLAIKRISSGLTSKGIAVLLFDFTGLGGSEGEFESITFTSNIQDVFAAADFLTKKYEAPKIIIGHSLGGAAALFAGSQLDCIEAVVTIGAPFDPYHVTKLLAEKVDEIEEKGKATLDIGGRPFTIAKGFIDDLEKHKPEEVAKKLRKAFLILHSPQDTIVGIDNAAKMYAAAIHPKSFISLDGADHLLSKRADSIYVGNMIAAWVEKYLNPNNQKAPLTSKSQVVSKTEQGSYTTEINAGNHHFLADEHEEIGGADLGPSPYELLSSSLAACTSMTLHIYAARKKWDLQEAIVHVAHNKDYAQDCDACEKSSSKIDHFNRKIELSGNFDDTQRQKLLEIADKCSVHKTLHSEVIVKTKLV